MRAGLDDVGIGALFGLADYRFEVLARLQHSNHLEKEYGAGGSSMGRAGGPELHVVGRASVRRGWRGI